MGKGKRLVIEGLDWVDSLCYLGYHTGVGELSQTGAKLGGAQAAEFAQLLHGSRLIQAGQDLLDAL
jgi:hypothetical protein